MRKVVVMVAAATMLAASAVVAAPANAATASGWIYYAGGTRCGISLTTSVTGTSSRTVSWSASVGCNYNMGGTQIKVSLSDNTTTRATSDSGWQSGWSSASTSGSYTTTKGRVIHVRATAITQSWILGYMGYLGTDQWVPVGCVGTGTGGRTASCFISLTFTT